MHSMDQRSAAWHECRLGKCTASKVADVIAKTKSGYSTSRANYRAQLVVERLTGTPTAGFVTAAMQHGIDTEAEARDAYMAHALCEVREVGFIDHPAIAMTGASPDGLIGEDGMLEIKCPQPATHIETLKGGTIPAKYMSQMLWQLACSGRQWCDFVSFNPDFPDEMRLFVQRVERDEAAIAELEKEVAAFLDEVEAEVAQLRERYLEKEAA